MKLSRFEFVRRNALQERQITVPGIITVSLVPTTTTTPAPAPTTDSPPATTTPAPASTPATSPTTAAPAPASSSDPGAGTGTAFGVGSGAGSGSSAGAGASAPVASSPIAGTNPIVASTPVPVPATAVPVAATSPAAATIATTPAAALPTVAATSIPILPSSALTTQLSTAANGTVFTSVLPIGAIPSASNPFGNVTAVNIPGANVPLSSIVAQPGTTNNGQDNNKNSSHHTNKNAIIIPIVVIFGLLALGLIIWFFVWRQRRSMENNIRKPLMLSKNRGLSTIGAGALGFTAAGMFSRGRRGEEYNESSIGHGGDNQGHSWLATAPIAEEMYSEGHYNQDQQYDGYQDQYNRGSIDSTGHEGQHQTMEMGNEEMAAAAGGAGYSHNPGSADVERQSFVSGEGGYLTADDDNYGRGQSQNDLLDPSHIRNDDDIAGQAYDGMDDAPAPVNPESPSRYTPTSDGGKPVRPPMNSSRWSG